MFNFHFIFVEIYVWLLAPTSSYVSACSNMGGLLFESLVNCSLLESADDVLNFSIKFELKWIILWMLVLLYTIILIVHVKDKLC